MLMTYYVNESSSAKAGQGAFAIHPDLKSLFCELLPENLPYNSVPPPSEIVEFLAVSDRGKTVKIQKSPLYSPSPSLHYMVDPLNSALPWLAEDHDRCGCIFWA